MIEFKKKLRIQDDVPADFGNDIGRDSEIIESHAAGTSREIIQIASTAVLLHSQA
jgi:hypothetical protein